MWNWIEHNLSLLTLLSIYKLKIFTFLIITCPQKAKQNLHLALWDGFQEITSLMEGNEKYDYMYTLSS